LATFGLSFTFIDQPRPETLFFTQAGIVLLLASLIVGIRASGTVSGERERQTWEVLMLTPLETWEIVGDKLLGIREAMHFYLLAYAVPATVVAGQAGWRSVLVTVLMLPVTWGWVSFMGATGLWCSARSPTSWRSLLATLGSGYGFGL